MTILRNRSHASTVELDTEPSTSTERPTSDPDTVLEVRDLQTQFRTKKGIGLAVKGVSFTLKRGETLGLVGESGCGKSITALSIIGLNPRPASEIVGGEILFQGEDLLQKTDDEMRGIRGASIAIALQDPMTALNPVFTVGEQLYEPLRLHRKLSGAALKERAIALMRMLRIPDPAARLSAYPDQFSGGMRQRAVGAIALSCEPQLLIADEPTTALDVTVQAAYLELLKEIQREQGLAILFITHDFGVVARVCDRVAVMYAGRIVETATTREVLESPAHPYTQALVKAVPDLEAPSDRLYSIDGTHPSLYQPIAGCAFADRCPYVEERCRTELPPPFEVAEGHTAACWRYAE